LGEQPSKDLLLQGLHPCGLVSLDAEPDAKLPWRSRAASGLGSSMIPMFGSNRSGTPKKAPDHADRHRAAARAAARGPRGCCEARELSQAPARRNLTGRDLRYFSLKTMPDDFKELTVETSAASF
jgi:hypothetical protein